MCRVISNSKHIVLLFQELFEFTQFSDTRKSVNCSSAVELASDMETLMSKPSLHFWNYWRVHLDDGLYMLCICVCSFRLSVGARVKTALFDCDWDTDDDSRLLRGVYEYGLGNWDAIKMDDNLQLYNKVLPAARQYQ